MQILYSILINLGLFVIGYLFVGSFNTSIIITKFFIKDDIRTHNSGNAGATNALRTYGKKIALLIFFSDLLKVIIPTLITIILLNHVNIFIELRINNIFVSPQSLALGIVIGHIYPIYFKFKGGKGVACTIGLFMTINILLLIIAAIVFFLIVIKTKYVSLGSIISAIILIPFVFIPWTINGILGYWFNNVELVNSFNKVASYWYVSPIIYTISAIITVIAHHSNIKRLINKTENKFSSSRKK
ncbi:G3P acyltransferase [Mycoplasmopsis maculosa]|uniref:Glycerol-3-phosphate acyltransferase n=1 Tax=Mycoplasmopsis maculosa TaxID=114885 RepID=A0A449B3R6_9BACT|nr:glycerol-3-phosphate 1-O-acyltransferase PlsY [Mycoplasmopsis maculosa]VEU75242.1 G3P acyltransferase [Mycoplasmopsis maculosa]